LRIKAAIFTLTFLLAALVPLGAREDWRARGIHDRMLHALGGDALEEAATLGFDFVVRDGDREDFRRSHLWDRTTGRYRLGLRADGRPCTVYFDLDLPGQGTAVCDGRMVGGKRADTLLEYARNAFVKDTWWLLMPFQWRMEGVLLTYIGGERSGKTRWDVVLVEFEPGEGPRAGDRFWAYVNRRTRRVDKWEMLLAGEEGEPRAVWWKGWEKHGGVTLSTVREFDGSSRVVALENLEVRSERFPERFEPPADVEPVRFDPEKLEAFPAPIPNLPVQRGRLPDAVTPRPAEPEAPAEVREEEPAPALEAVDGTLLVTNKGDDTLVLVDPVSMEVRGRIATGEGPSQVVVGPKGRRAYVANYGHSAAGSTISVIDLGRAEVVETWDLAPHSRPHGMAFDGKGRLWVTVETSQAVLCLDPARGGAVVRMVATGEDIGHMLAVAPRRGLVFVSNIGSGTVTVAPTEGGEVRQIEVGRGPEGIAVSPDETEVWVANRYEDQLVVLAPGAGTVKARIPTGDFPTRVRFTPDGSRVLVSHVRGGEILVYDARGRRRVATLAGGEAPVAVLATPDGRHAFVADTRANRVRAYDLVTGRLLGEVDTGIQPAAAAWVPGTGR
jgi:YVTN family beta-propeller protein